MNVLKELVWGCLLNDFKVGLSAAAHQIAEYVKCLEIVLSMNVRQDIDFKNSGREICPSVIKLEQDDHRPLMTKPCRRPLRRTVDKRVVNLPDNSTLLVKRLYFICTS
ncbi:histone-lysine N-methyltransferase SETMAR [Trichonephila inaurata madagascariensis]|uniref:Histone-lysine N-methyltransferase SETMAR n=1 Tax=Trichonephila inaurata madagascariensis TaxID=2747483 RepID=A0A8X6XRD2_9ARAC|nr:histone-lysine N-methyltransferase SETMAR [Trichonephila inaurata madagascariensis]